MKVKLQRPATLLKRDSNTGVFLWMLWNFYKRFFHKTPPVIDLSGFKLNKTASSGRNKRNLEHWLKPSIHLIQYLRNFWCSTAFKICLRKYKRTRLKSNILDFIKRKLYTTRLFFNARFESELISLIVLTRFSLLFVGQIK